MRTGFRSTTLLFVSLLIVGISPPAAADAVKTVSVDCAKGDSINDALESSSDVLVVEVRGLCTEAVVVARDHVTLRGTSPDSDGIESPGPAAEGEYARDPLRILEVEDVTVENLGLRGGQNGVWIRGSLLDPRKAASASPIAPTFRNCTVSGSNAVAVLVHNAYARLSDVTIVDNHGYGLLAMRSDVHCTGCTLEDSGIWNVYGRHDAFLQIVNSTISGGRGVVVFDGSRLRMRDSTVDAAPSFYVGSHSHADVGSTEFSGFLGAFDKGMIWLQNVIQTESSGAPHFVDYDGMLETFWTILEDDVLVDRFAKAVIDYQSIVNGDLTCGSAGDAVVMGGSSVLGTVSGCEHAP